MSDALLELASSTLAILGYHHASDKCLMYVFNPTMPFADIFDPLKWDKILLHLF